MADREFTDFDGVTYEIVWAGDMGMSLTAPRPTKPLNSFEAPDPKKDEGKVKRLYNKTGKHARDPEFWLKGGMNPGKVDND